MRTAPAPLALNAIEQGLLTNLKAIMQGQADYGTSQEFQRDLLALVSSPGKTIAGVARLLGVTRQYVHQLAVQAGLKPGRLRAERRLGRQLADELKEETSRHARMQRVRLFAKMWKKGLTTPEIARMMSMETRSVAVLISNFRREYPTLFPVRNKGLSKTMAKSWNRRTRRTAAVALRA